jgi:hypothetical protein
MVCANDTVHFAGPQAGNGERKRTHLQDRQLEECLVHRSAPFHGLTPSVLSARRMCEVYWSVTVVREAEVGVARD